MIYLGTPGNQMHADYCRGMPVLLSYACRKPWHDDYLPSFGRVLIDSGAYSEFTQGTAVDLGAYAGWVEPFRGVVDAVAALDDIRGDWKRGLANHAAYPWMFPTFHDSDPDEALSEILDRSPKWIGLGMVPPRTSVQWLRRTLDRIPKGVHVHGWALASYAALPRLDSVDSTNWFRDSWKFKSDLPWLTPAECVEIVIKREQRRLWPKDAVSSALELPFPDNETQRKAGQG